MRMRGACPLPLPRHPQGADDGSLALGGPGDFGAEIIETSLFFFFFLLAPLKGERFLDGIFYTVVFETTL